VTPGLFLLGAVVWGLAIAITGWTGVGYPIVYLLATLPGWPIGRRLFGRGHPVAWVSGALVGYGLTALALWVPIALGVASLLTLSLSWAAATMVIWRFVGRGDAPLVDLPPWPARATRPLVLLLALVPLLVALPYGRIGEMDDQGNRRYRAYFTADFVWHEALTAELARFDSPPRNPYLASQPLHYYWSYFLLPGAVTGTVGTPPAPIERYLIVNGLLSGVLFVATIFLAAWCAVPRAWSAAAATALALLAASAEGLYATVDLLGRGVSLSALKALNIDAITSWVFSALTIDGLPRAIWYTPQHSMSCALGLIAVIIAARSGRAMRPKAAVGAGLALGLAFTMSPFPAGAFTLVYAAAILWDAVLAPRTLLRVVATQAGAVVVVAAALAWCVMNGTFEGAGGAISFGLSSRSARQPLLVAVLALGPLLVPVIAGLAIAAFRGASQPLRPAIAAVVLAAGLFYGVTLVLEPIWVGWRAGNIILVTAPALAAAAIAAARDRVGPRATTALLAILFAAGLPTTLIDSYNTQDVSNTARSPGGFRWTVVLTPSDQQALRWIDVATPRDSVVQMSLEPRGRETWSLIPSSARRRMAAGLPISLLRTPEYEAPARAADALYAAGDARQAWRIARTLGVNYVYVGRVEREAYPEGLRFDDQPDLFRIAYAAGDSTVYAVR
jgi:hypothetical protein